MICHAPADKAPLGTLFIESRRHFLDFSRMNPEEAASLGKVLQRIYRELKELTQAERIYQLSTMEGVSHFHAWLVPRRTSDAQRGLKFLERDDRCEEKEAVELAGKLRERMRREDKGNGTNLRMNAN